MFPHWELPGRTIQSARLQYSVWRIAVFNEKSNKSLEVSIILLIFTGRKRSETIMSTKVMIQLIADYFKTQPVLRKQLLEYLDEFNNVEP